MAKKSKLQSGTSAIAAKFADALREIGQAVAIDDPDPNLPREGIKPGEWDGAPRGRMPPGCPVTVLGMKGETVYIVSATGHLHAIEKFDHPTIVKLFAPYFNYALWAWPGMGPSGKDADGNPLPPRVKRLERDKCVECLVQEAGRRGIFDPADQKRGRGGWRSEDGEFIWHSGRHLWRVPMETKGRALVPGQLQDARPSEYMGYFYAQDSAILEPWQSPVDMMDSPGHLILEYLQSWNWERKWLDPVLALGWLVTALMGAALDERPIIFVTGGRGTGKSTLGDILKAIIGRALYSTANTTAAGIYQNIKQDSRPVLVDEFEAKARGEKEQSIIELARQAYSGAKLYRGGQNHDGVEFELRCSFAFSAIIPPPLSVQDRSRMAILNLKPLSNDGSAEPVIKEEMGRMLLRRVMDGWHDFYTTLLPKWRRLLHQAKFDARMQDTYGTLLAAAELVIGEMGLVHAGFPDNAGDGKLYADDVIVLIQHATKSEIADQEEKWETVIDKILSATIDNWKAGEKPTVGMVLEGYEANEIAYEEARARLGLAGLGIRRAGDATQGYALCVPKSHPALDRIFGDTDFKQGNWYTALKQAPDAIVPRGLGESAYTVKISKVAKYCLLVDMDAYEKRRG